MGEKNRANETVTDVYITPSKHGYSAFRKGTDERDASEFGAFSAPLVYRIAEITESAIKGGTEFDCAFRELSELYTLCRKNSRILAILLGEWICDLCLVTGNVGKISELSQIGAGEAFLVSDFAVGELVNAFFKRDASELESTLENALQYLSEYDIRKSPCFEKNQELYRRAVLAVIPKVLSAALGERGRGFFLPEPVTTERTAFMGLPCTSGCPAKITVTYLPYSDNTELRTFITAVLKHTDNLVRLGFGAKSKIVGFTLSSEYRRVCSDAIRAAIPDFLPMPAKVGRKPSPKKEQLRREKTEAEKASFEPISLDIDFAKAKRLEAESWKIAELLGADYGGNDISFSVKTVYGDTEIAEEAEKTLDAPTDNGQTTVNSDIPEEWQEFFASLTDTEKQFLCAMSKGLDVNAFSKKRGGMAQGYVDAINEKSSDTYGDIIIEDFDFIEDYRKELEEIFSELYNTEVL